MDSDAQDRALASVAEWNKAGTSPPSPTLLPCPFCGGPPLEKMGPGTVRCGGLYCPISLEWMPVATWNTRAAPEPVEEKSIRQRKYEGPRRDMSLSDEDWAKKHPAEPKGTDDFPEEAWKAWIHEMAKVKHVDPEGWMKRSARWGLALRSEEVADLKHGIVGLQGAEAHQASRVTSVENSWSKLVDEWSARCDAAEAARDAALARVEELEEGHLWTADEVEAAKASGKQFERLFSKEMEALRASLASALEERDAARKDADDADSARNAALDEQGRLKRLIDEHWKPEEEDWKRDEERLHAYLSASQERVKELETCAKEGHDWSKVVLQSIPPIHTCLRCGYQSTELAARNQEEAALIAERDALKAKSARLRKALEMVESSGCVDWAFGRGDARCGHCDSCVAFAALKGETDG